MKKFALSCVKFTVVAFWLFAGTVGILAARWNARQLDGAMSELNRYRTAMTAEVVKLQSQLESADNEAKTLAAELDQFRTQLADTLVSQDSLRIEAAKWRAKFETICRKVEDLAGNAISVVVE